MEMGVGMGVGVGTAGRNSYNTPTNNALVDSTNPEGMAQTTEHWFEGYGKYGVRAVWMDEAEPVSGRASERFLLPVR